jgi:Ca-activated chloride channel family protein
MTDHDPLDVLRSIDPPPPREAARREAIARAMAQFDDAKNNASLTQGHGLLARLISGINNWRSIMSTKSLAGPALATLLIVPLAGLATWSIIGTQQMALKAGTSAYVPMPAAAPAQTQAVLAQPRPVAPAPYAVDQLADQQMAELETRREEAAPALLAPRKVQTLRAAEGITVAEQPAPTFSSEAMPRIVETVPLPEASRDRVQEFSTNTVKRVAEEPVSTFSIDADTASYSMVRRALKAGRMPDRGSVRVEEMVNYFPYDWPAPDSAQTPFKASVTVTPTPWNQHTRLMHVAIKGYEFAAAQRPRTNLVFLVDTSGSMQDEDKLPLLKASLRLLLDRLEPDDSVALVTYAGEAGVALEPTKASDKGKILDAIERLGAGGSTAGAAGIEEAYRLARSSYVEGGVNRVMLATDGDFNVGASDDEALKRLIEEKRKSGVFLSVLGFGEGNYNDQLMQVIAQNGNGTASYIDTLAEAEKTLVQEAGSTLFPIAKDVKIQVEFNPQAISEYRLIGYETRALNREDFNNDRVDAGEIGSGHAVTAIYELTPKGSPALSVDAPRYGVAEDVQAPLPGAELAFVKIRYKLPGGETSQLISQPVDEASAVADLASAPQDVRFSIAVAAFGQKLRGTDALAGYGYDAIGQLGQDARGADPFGYRSEFTTLVRLAAGLER